MPVVYKSDSTVQFSTLTKFDDERGELLAVVYLAEHRDSQGDIASTEVVKDMAYSAMRDGVEIDVMHDGKPVGRDKAYPAESFLITKGDSRFAGWKDNTGAEVDLTGAWATVVKIDDPALRERVKSGELAGVSMAGIAEVEAEKSDDDEPPTWFQKALAAIGLGALTKAADGSAEEDMKPEDIEKIVASAVAQVAKAMKPEPTAEEKAKAERDALVKDVVAEVVKALKPAEGGGKPEGKAEEKPEGDDVFKGDPTDAKAVRDHLTKVKVAKLRAAVKWEDPTSVQDYLTKLEDLQGSKADDESDDDDDGVDEPVGKSAQRVSKGQKKSKATAGLSKAESDDVEAMLASLGVGESKGK